MKVEMVFSTGTGPAMKLYPETSEEAKLLKVLKAYSKEDLYGDSALPTIVEFVSIHMEK